MSKPDFWWFEGESVRTIAKQLLKIGTNNARLKVIPNGEGVLLQVELRAEASGGVGDGFTPTTRGFPPINEAHPCPPDC